MRTEVIERLKSLEIDHGVLTADIVKRDARNPESPLHSEFIWDDAVAAEIQRTDRARALIRSVRVMVTDKKIKMPVIAYVRDPDARHKDPGYRSTASLRTEKESARRALIAELERAEYAMRRAYDVAEALGLLDQVEVILAELRNIKNVA